MKRNKKIGILCGILICVSLAAFGVSKYEKQKEIIKNSDEIIMEIKKEDVKVLSWECDMGSFAFHRDENGSWLYDEDEEFPVDKEKIENLLELFEEFGVAFMIEEVEDFEQYGLDTPVCTICMETESDSYEIRLGNYSTMDSQRYVSIGDGNVYLVKTDPLEQFEIEISEVFHHDEIPELKEVTQIQFSGTESEDIIYEKDSTNTYSSEDVYFVKREESLLPLDTSRVQEYLDTPELSVVFEYADIGEDKDKETKETFALYIGRDPKEQEVEESDKDTEEEVTAYARIGESKIIYQLTTEQYKKLKEITYDTLRHQELFWADFSDVHQLDILLEDNHYVITSELEDGDRTYYYQEEELEMANIQSAISGLKVKTFSDKTPKQKEEISLTLYLDNENFPKVQIQLYRYDGEDCIAVVDGETIALVERTCVVDLIEAVNHIVLK